ncbi:MAG: hypothetical protein ACR2PA_18645 [Hyphomicrobiaceae bacterium]
MSRRAIPLAAVYCLILVTGLNLPEAEAAPAGLMAPDIGTSGFAPLVHRVHGKHADCAARGGRGGHRHKADGGRVGCGGGGSSRESRKPDRDTRDRAKAERRARRQAQERAKAEVKAQKRARKLQRKQVENAERARRKAARRARAEAAARSNEQAKKRARAAEQAAAEARKRESDRRRRRAAENERIDERGERRRDDAKRADQKAIKKRRARKRARAEQLEREEAAAERRARAEAEDRGRSGKERRRARKKRDAREKTRSARRRLRNRKRRREYARARRPFWFPGPIEPDYWRSPRGWALIPVPPVHRQRLGRQWEFLGRQRVGIGRDRDVVVISRAADWYRNRSFRRLRFVVDGGDVVFRRIRLIYINGYSEIVPVKRYLDAGREFDIGLPGERSYLRRIEMIYSGPFALSIGPGGIRAARPTIAVYGLRGRWPVAPPPRESDDDWDDREDPRRQSRYDLDDDRQDAVCLRFSTGDQPDARDWVCVWPGEPSPWLPLSTGRHADEHGLQIASRFGTVCLQHERRGVERSYRSRWACSENGKSSRELGIGRGRDFANHRVRFRASLPGQRLCMRLSHRGRRGPLTTDWKCSEDGRASQWLALAGDDRYGERQIMLRLD